MQFETRVHWCQFLSRSMSDLRCRISGCLLSPEIRQRCGLVAVTACCLLRFLSSCEAADQAASMVQRALRSEIDFDIDERFRLIDEALLKNPALPEAHWARGEVRVNGKWQSLEDAAAELRTRTDLLQYEGQRSREEETVDGHVRMAEYCHKHHLAVQERAHWNAVLALEPNHAIARQKLGHVKVDGAWIDDQQLDQQKKTERASKDYVAKHKNEILRLVRAFDNKTIARQQLTYRLDQFRDPLVIPWLEQVLWGRGAAGGLCAVETFARWSAPEASLSLVRHALDFPDESVRDAATNALRRRDEFSFVPTLLASLKNPVTKTDQFVTTRDDQVIWRRSLSLESQDIKKIAVFDRVMSLSGLSPDSVAATANWARQNLQAGDLELVQINQNIESTNARVMAVLATIATPQPSASVGSSAFEEPKKTPEDWWNWWNDRIESYPADAKSVQTRYELAYVPQIVVERPPQTRRECLAPGTEIWTQIGPVAVNLVEVGDMVLTQHQRTGELKFAPVLATSSRPPEKLLRLTVGSETVRATGGHPFWVSGMGWIKARSLEPGMGLHTAKGVVMLDAVEEESESTRAHNLIVEECHSYFVGRNLILSHDNTMREPVANRVPGLRDDAVNARRN